MGSWLGLGGPRCVVGNAAMVALCFTEVYSYFGCLADLPLCVQPWAVVPHLQLQSQILGWEGFGGSASPARAVLVSAAINVPVTAGQVCLWPPGMEPPWGLPFSPPSHKGHLGQREESCQEKEPALRDVVVFLERLENWISQPLKTLVSAIYLLSYF